MKYEFKGDPYSSHSRIIELIRKEKRTGLSILDVGCAGGFLARAFSGMGHTVFGVDIDEAALKAAKPFCAEVKVVDLETDGLAGIGRSFDIIILGDVIEHLRDPESAIRSVSSLLNKGGKIILSVPNVANIYVRLKLLLGDFDYQEKGILDRTHLRFFTKKTLFEMITRCHLTVVRCVASPIPLPLVWDKTAKGKPFHFIHRFNAALAAWFSTLFGYQFIVLLSR